MADLHLKEKPTLAEIQAFVVESCRARGFDKESVPELLMLLTEEMGELCKAIRKTVGVSVDVKETVKHRIDLEASDVLWLLLCICDRYGIDLEKAFREKEEINRQRTWHKEKPAE